MLHRLFLSVILSGLLLLQTIIAIPEPVNALAENIVIAQLQTGGNGSGTATEEFVLLYNTSDVAIEITDWCIEYSSVTDNKGFEYCMLPPDLSTELWVLPGEFMSLATDTFLEANELFISDFIFSGGMATGSGHLRVFDSLGNEQDKLGWGEAIAPETSPAEAHNGGEVLSRDVTTFFTDTDDNSVDFISRTILPEIMSGLYEVEISIDKCENIDGLQLEVPYSFLDDVNGECYLDWCPLIDGLQRVVPVGFEKLADTNECSLLPLEDAILFITELLPNAPSTDTGNEFIELYNPMDRRVELRGYVLQIGPSYTKEFVFTSGSIGAQEYMIFSDIETSLVLPNATGQQLRLIAPNEEIVSSSHVYSNASDNESWALVEDVWIWTNQITPSSANKPYLQESVDEVLGVTTVFAPCPEGKTRNPDTNRCRNIESALTILQPCAADEYRSEETNRCRKTTSTASSLTSCRADQERNPETNRCRMIATSSSLQPCDEGQERNPETNRCRKVAQTAAIGALPLVSDVQVTTTAGQVNWAFISLTLIGTMSYMVYEWRVELSRKLRLLRILISTD
jgi:hypothetical protein